VDRSPVQGSWETGSRGVGAFIDIIDLIASTVASGKEVRIGGLGMFERDYRKSREARNQAPSSSAVRCGGAGRRRSIAAQQGVKKTFSVPSRIPHCPGG
jgi:hypothetical protein